MSNETTTTKKMTANDSSPMNIATISAGFEKGDFLVREEQGNRVYFDFFEEVRKQQQTSGTKQMTTGMLFNFPYCVALSAYFVSHRNRCIRRTLICLC
jgi:hypothetical protein